MRRSRSVALVVAGMVLGAMLLTPAGAHVSKSVGHNWSHYSPLAQRLFFTKAQSNARYEARCAPGTENVSCVSVVSGSMVVPAGGSRFGSVSESGSGSTTETDEFGIIAPFEVRITNFIGMVGGQLTEGPVSFTVRAWSADTAITCAVPPLPNVAGCSSNEAVVAQVGTFFSVEVENADSSAWATSWSMTLERV